MACAGQLTIIADSNEDDAAMSVGETNDRVHQLVIARRPVGLGDEFGRELFAGVHEPTKFCGGEHDMNLSRRLAHDDSILHDSLTMRRQEWTAKDGKDAVNELGWLLVGRQVLEGGRVERDDAVLSLPQPAGSLIPNVSAVSALDCLTNCSGVSTCLARTYCAHFFGNVPYLRGWPADPSEPVITFERGQSRFVSFLRMDTPNPLRP